MQQTPSSKQQPESLLRDDNQETGSFSYPSQAYPSAGPFAPLQSPAHQTPLRHRPSASNDALRAFGAIPPSATEPGPKQPFPQELYSSSAANAEPAAFPRNLNAQEFEYPVGQSAQVLHATFNGAGGSVPPSMTSRQASAPFGMPSQPHSSRYYSQTVASNAPGVLGGPPPPPPPIANLPQALPIMPMQPSANGNLPPNGLISSMQGVPPSAATLAQMLQSLPPQKKNAVIGRLQEYAIQGISPPANPPSTAQPVSTLVPHSQLSGLPQEDISTIFVVGFPDDITEREFQNMFTFCPGYEAATLKVPSKDTVSQPPTNPAVAAAASALAGASDPYNLVTVNSGGVVVDQGNNTAPTTSATWASGLEDQYTRQALAAAALASSSTTTSELAQQIALAQQAQPKKQTIGFAKFRTREEALQARDLLHGRKIDLEKGSILKAEMAKKNLHTKRNAGPTAPNGANQGYPDGAANGIPSMPHSSIPSQTFQETERPVGSSMSSMSVNPSLAPSPNDISASSHAILSNSLSMHPDSPTIVGKSLDDQSMYLGNGHLASMTKFANEAPALYPSVFSKASGLSEQPAQSLMALTGNESFHALPNKPVSDVVKANALPPTNLPPPIITSNLNQRKPPSTHGTSPPMSGAQQEVEAGYISDAMSSRRSDRSRSVSVSRYGGYTPPPQLEDGTGPHLPAHLLQDDALGTPQQMDYPPGIFNSAVDYTSAGSIRGPQRKMTNVSIGPFSPTNEVPDSSASSAAGSVSSGGAESMSISTASGNTPAAPPAEFGRQRQSTMSSVKSVNTDQQTRTSGEHNRGRQNAADQNPPINTLYVGNLPTTFTSPQQIKMLEDNLLQLFTRCPGFVKLALRQKNNGPMCFVEFDDVPNASRALNDMYGNTLNGLIKGGGIRLSYSKNPLGVRTTVPNGPGGTGRLTSPIQSPTSNPSLQFGNMPLGMQDGRMVTPLSITQPMDMPPRGRMRGDTMEMMMGPTSPQRYHPSSPPSNQPGMFGGAPAGFSRGPGGMGGPGTQPFVMASSPPSMATYQPPATFQSFMQPPTDLNREAPPQPAYDPNQRP